VLLKDAILPNLVQTLENNPAFLHGGPFANIAHGCNSLIATKTALGMADYVVTEAGFGADLGAEKFMDIKCRIGGLKPDAIVLVATVRALKMNGGVAKKDLTSGENVEAVRAGSVNLRRHIENVKKFGITPTIAINHFYLDTDAELAVIVEMAKEYGAEAVICKHWADGSAGAEELARIVAEKADKGAPDFKPLYPSEMKLAEKIETIATEIYRAGSVSIPSSVRSQLKQWEDMGYGHYPICVAKTQYGFSTDPTKLGAPEGHEIAIREVRISAGAGFVVAIAGDIMTMPGLPKVPSAENIYIDESGQIEGLF
jgi:formate--tetrahydrofolate ligase